MAQLKLCSAILMACLIGPMILPTQAAPKKNNINALLIKRQYGPAVKQLKGMAEKGNAWAQFKLGSLYRVGLGVPVDDNRATMWLHKSAAGGNAAAAAVLKRMAIKVPPTIKKTTKAVVLSDATENTVSLAWLPSRSAEQQSWLALAAARNLPSVIDELKIVNDKLFAIKRDRALLAASLAGSQDVVASMLEMGANPNTRDDRARTPVIIATTAGNLPLLNQLLSATPELSSADASGTTALGYAASNCDAKTFNTLVDEGAKDDESATPALITVFKSCANAVDFLPSVRGNLVNAKDKDGRSIVWYAAAIKDSAVLNATLAAGGDASLPDAQGYAPLHVAAMAGQTEIVKVLLALGSSVDVQSKDGTTPLMLATTGGQVDCIKLLAEQTKDIDIKDSAGETALLRAVKVQNREAIQVLLVKGANRRARSISGETPEKLAERLDPAIAVLFAKP
jgi:uncharacterized protein